MLPVPAFLSKVLFSLKTKLLSNNCKDPVAARIFPTGKELLPKSDMGFVTENEEVKSDILPKSGAGQDGTEDLVKSYMKDTPGQDFKKFKEYIKHR